MKGMMLTKKLWTKITSISLAVISVTALTTAVITFHSNTVGEEGENDFRSDLPDIVINANEDVEYDSLSSSSGVVLKATNGLEFRSGTKSQTVDFENPNQNQCTLIISIHLSNGECIYKSGYIYPGETISKIELSSELQSGMYTNAVLCYRCYSVGEEHIAISQCEIPIEIRCI